MVLPIHPCYTDSAASLANYVQNIFFTGTHQAIAGVLMYPPDPAPKEPHITSFPLCTGMSKGLQHGRVNNGDAPIPVLPSGRTAFSPTYH